MEVGGESDHSQQWIEAEASARPVSIMLVAGRRIGAAGLKTMLLAHRGFRFAAEAACGPEAAVKARQAQPVVILMDADGVDAEAIEVARQLHDSAPESHLILFSDHVTLEALGTLARIPVHGLLAWNDATAENVEGSIAQIRGGLHVISRTCVMQALSAGGSAQVDLSAAVLTPRELAVLRGLAGGLSEVEVAEKLGVAPRTVQRMVAEIKEKLGAKNLVQLGVLAVQWELLGAARRLGPGAESRR
jgi:DNA-binding NarL/FixJ family response regulator